MNTLLSNAFGYAALRATGMRKTAKKLLIVAGEASGDAHGSLLARELKKSLPGVQLLGCGGDALSSQGVEMLADLASLSVVGGAEVLKKFKVIRAIFQSVVRFLDAEKPDAVILIDYPGFNLRLAREAKKRGIGVIYYVSPQIWAWAPWRIHKIRRLVDLMLVILPFEKDIYERAGIPVQFVGHPSLDRTLALPSRQTWLESQKLDVENRYMALLPGSRLMEVQNNLPAMLDAASRVAKAMPQLRFLLPCAGEHVRAAIEGLIAMSMLPVHVVDGQSMEVAKAADLALVASGTATLETALMGTPMLIVYKVHALSYVLGCLLVRIPYLGLVNVLAGKLAVPEFLQARARGDLLAQEAVSLLSDPARIWAMKKEFEGIRKSLGAAGASARAATAVTEFFRQRDEYAALH